MYNILYMDKIKKQKPSAYKSMRLGSKGLSKSTPEKKQQLLNWEKEKWINLTAKIIDKKIQPCGMKGKKQQKLNLPSVCRPLKRVNDKTPKLAQNFTTQQIKKAIRIKKQGKTINWSKL